MEDLQRLDLLINQLLQVGRLDAIVTENEAEDIELNLFGTLCDDRLSYSW